MRGCLLQVVNKNSTNRCTQFGHTCLDMNKMGLIAPEDRIMIQERKQGVQNFFEQTTKTVWKRCWHRYLGWWRRVVCASHMINKSKLAPNNISCQIKVDNWKFFPAKQKIITLILIFPHQQKKKKIMAFDLQCHQTKPVHGPVHLRPLSDTPPDLLQNVEKKHAPTPIYTNMRCTSHSAVQIPQLTSSRL